MLKPELYMLIKVHKSKFKKCSVDEIFKKYGHSVLRLSTYHPELNTIDKIWSVVKEWAAARNTTFKIEDVRVLCKTKFDQIGQNTTWLSICNHVNKMEVDY